MGNPEFALVVKSVTAPPSALGVLPDQEVGPTRARLLSVLCISLLASSSLLSIFSSLLVSREPGFASLLRSPAPSAFDYPWPMDLDFWVYLLHILVDHLIYIALQWMEGVIDAAVAE